MTRTIFFLSAFLFSTHLFAQVQKTDELFKTLQRNDSLLFSHPALAIVVFTPRTA